MHRCTHTHTHTHTHAGTDTCTDAHARMPVNHARKSTRSHTAGTAFLPVSAAHTAAAYLLTNTRPIDMSAKITTVRQESIQTRSSATKRNSLAALSMVLGETHGYMVCQKRKARWILEWMAPRTHDSKAFVCPAFRRQRLAAIRIVVGSSNNAVVFIIIVRVLVAFERVLRAVSALWVDVHLPHPNRFRPTCLVVPAVTIVVHASDQRQAEQTLRVRYH